MISFSSWEVSVLGVKPLDIDDSGDFDCVDVPKSFAQYLWPNVSWQTSVGYGDAKEMFANASDLYWQKIANTGGATPNIDIKQGDVCVYGPTPTPGYTNQYSNPYGHVGVVDSLYAGGVVLIQQESGSGRAPFFHNRDFTFAPLIGVLRPKVTIGEDMVDYDTILNAFVGVLFRNPTAEEVARYNGKVVADALLKELNGSAERKQIVAQYQRGAQSTNSTDQVAQAKAAKYDQIKAALS
jgi:hypothetical protein